MSLEFTRGMQKLDEYFEREIENSVVDLLEEHYGVIWSEFTQKQIDEISRFASDNEWSLLSVGFRNIVNWWESNQYED